MKQLISQFFLLILVLISCAPQKADQKQAIEKNNKEIITLEQKIDELNKKLAELAELADEQDQQTIEDSNGLSDNLDDIFIGNMEIETLRLELINTISKLEIKLDTRLIKLEHNYQGFKEKLDKMSINNLVNYVDISQFELAHKKIQEIFSKKYTMLNLKIIHQDKSLSDSNFFMNIKLAEIKKQVSEFEANYKLYFMKAQEVWEQRFTDAFNNIENSTKQVNSKTKGDIRLSKELDELLLNEVQRVKVTVQSLEAKLKHMYEKVDDSNTAVATTQQKKDDKKNIEDNKFYELETLLNKSKEQMSNLESIVKNVTGRSLVSDIIEKQYEPCTTGLKKNDYCYTIGTIITKLGGVFIDPTAFKMTTADFVSYLSLSGITIDMAIQGANSYLIPSPGNVSKLKACNGKDGLKINLPTQTYWPRAVLLFLIFEKFEKDIIVKRNLSAIARDIQPAVKVESWYRNRCYNKKVKGANGSDHIHAAGMDLSFINKKSFNYYRDFIAQHIWKNDTFGIVYPLKSSDLKFNFGIGLGHGEANKGKFHMGVASKNPPRSGNLNRRRRDWGYESTRNGNYPDNYYSKND